MLSYIYFGVTQNILHLLWCNENILHLLWCNKKIFYIYFGVTLHLPNLETYMSAITLFM